MPAEPNATPATGEGAQAPDPKDAMYPLVVNRQKIEVDLDEMTRRAQLGTAHEQLVADRQAWKEDKAVNQEAVAFLEAARANPALAAHMDELYNHVKNGTPMPNMAPAANGEDGGEAQTEQGATPSAPPAALEQAVRALTEESLQRKDAEAVAERDRILRERVSATPELGDASDGFGALALELARGKIAAQPELTPQDALALSAQEIKAAREFNADTERRARQQREEFGTPPPGSGSPWLTPEKKATKEELMDGGLKDRIMAHLRDATHGPP